MSIIHQRGQVKRFPGTAQVLAEGHLSLNLAGAGEGVEFGIEFGRRTLAHG